VSRPTCPVVQHGMHVLQHRRFLRQPGDLADRRLDMDDFEAAAAQIKDKTGAYILPFGSAQFTDIMPWLLSNGASTLNADWTPL